MNRYKTFTTAQLSEAIKEDLAWLARFGVGEDCPDVVRRDATNRTYENLSKMYAELARRMK